MQSDSFFSSFQKNVIAADFALVGKYHIVAPDDVAYHIPCEKAKETVFVFHKRDKRFVAIASFHESIGMLNTEPYDCYWSLDIVSGPQEFKDILNILTLEEKQAFNEMGEYPITGYNRPPQLTYFDYNTYFAGNSYICFSNESKLNVTPEQVIEDIVSSYEQMKRFLASGRFPDFPNHRLYNSYCFSDGKHNHNRRIVTKAERVFRERFDIKYLMTVARFQ